MKYFINKIIFCAGLLTVTMVTANLALGGTSWYSPYFSAPEIGEILDITFETESGKPVPVKTYREPSERTVWAQVGRDMDKTALVPDIEVTDGFTIDVDAGRPSDFSKPVTYTLHANQMDRTYEWKINVFDADTARIIQGEEFKDWKLRAKGYDRKKHFGEYLDNRDGLFFRMTEPIEPGSWALFYYEIDRPVKEVKFNFDQLEDHHQKWLEILDLAAVDSKSLRQKDWPQGELDKTGAEVRWKRRLYEKRGMMYCEADFSQKSVKGPIAIKYGGGKVTGNWNYRIQVKKVMLIFE